MDAGLLYGCLTPHPPILVPAVAGHRVGQVRHTRDAMAQVANDIGSLSPDVIVLISPHAPLHLDAMSFAAAERYAGDFGAFGAPGEKLSLSGDPELASALDAACRALGVPVERMGRGKDLHRLDHGAAVPLFFLHEAGVRSKLLLLSFSSLDVEVHGRFGRAIAAACRTAGRRAVLVASGDMSHRLFPGAPAGFSPRGREFDDAVVGALQRQEFHAIRRMDDDLLAEAGECGYRSLVIALGAMPESEPEVLSYEGPFGVGYLVARFRRRPAPWEPAPSADVPSDTAPAADGEAPAPWDAVPSREATSTADDQASSAPWEAAPAADRLPASPDAMSHTAVEEREALGLARLAIESYVKEGRLVPPPREVKGLLAQRAGVFVSLKIAGELRGCIGTFQPTDPNVATEIVHNAVASATRDPRFPPVERDELPDLQYSIDILSEPEPIADPALLDPRRYGVIVQSANRRGLLLPDLEGVDTVEDQVSIARRKAGILTGAPLQLYRFTVRRIGEK